MRSQATEAPARLPPLPYTPSSMFSRSRFYWVVAVCGGVLMALEILSSRVLAPHYGNSVYVWGSIISVFLAALSLGYLWGGRLADREPSMASLGRMVVLAAAFEAVLLLLAGSLPAASFAPPSAHGLIYERVTPYQTLQVYESEGVRTLRSDRVPQAAVSLATHESTLPYNHAAPAVLLISPHPRKALLI